MSWLGRNLLRPISDFGSTAGAINHARTLFDSSTAIVLNRPDGANKRDLPKPPATPPDGLLAGFCPASSSRLSPTRHDDHQHRQHNGETVADVESGI
jgi:hypothetical protein